MQALKPRSQIVANEVAAAQVVDKVETSDQKRSTQLLQIYRQKSQKKCTAAKKLKEKEQKDKNSYKKQSKPGTKTSLKVAHTVQYS